MNKQEIKDYLKQNLRVYVTTDEGRLGRLELTVMLKFEDELINEHSTLINLAK